MANKSQISYPQGIHEAFSSLSPRHWWFKSRAQLINQVLRSMTRFKNSQNQFHYLEAGCGTAYVLHCVQTENPNWSCLGIEGQQEAVMLAKNQYPSLDIKALDLKYFVPESPFHCIGCFDVLEHIDDDFDMLQRFSSFLYPGGTLLLTVPQHSWLWSNADEFAGHKRRYSRKDLFHKLRSAGFSIAYSSSFVSFLLPLMFLQRVFLGKLSKQYDPLSELKINHFINFLFYLAMRCERFFMRLGVKFPFGGSVVVLADKK